MKSSHKLALLALAMFLIAAMSLTLGKYPISIRELCGMAFSKIVPIGKFWTDRVETVFFNVRLPRVALACMVGCCLSVAGASYQGIFRNPMAAPDVLGASTGAAFGALLAILLRLNRMQTTLSAFAFSMLCVTLVLLCGRRSKGNAILGLVLSGIMIGSLFQAATSFLKTVADPADQLPAMTYWLMGSLSGASTKDVSFVFFPMALGLVPIFLLRWRINILTMDEDEARSLGVNTRRMRAVIVVCATLVTAASVSVSGMIGWVGLVIPHLCRRLVGSDYRVLIPASALAGAVFLLVVDNFSRCLMTVEIPIGILTAFVGAPFFIWLLLGKEEK
ncbi:MAG: iron ABC transporter permease [Oscillospiraceae bacterium]